MREMPHCPLCGRADTVNPRRGLGRSYICIYPYCEQGVITVEEIRDPSFVETAAGEPFANADAVRERATSNAISEDCRCERCARERVAVE